MTKRVKRVPQASGKTLELQYFAMLRKLIMAQKKIINEEAARLFDKRGHKLDDGEVNDIEKSSKKMSKRTKALIASIGLAAYLASLGRTVSKFATTQTVKAVKHLTGKSAFIPSTQAMTELQKSFVKQNVTLIKSLTDNQIEKVEGILQRGLSKGATKESITAQIQKATGVQKSRAKLIATDQIQSFRANMQREQQKAMGIKKYIWQTMNDDRVRDLHESYGGNVYEWGANFEDSPPGTAINCRCIAIPVFDKNQINKGV